MYFSKGKTMASLSTTACNTHSSLALVFTSFVSWPGGQQALTKDNLYLEQK